MKKTQLYVSFAILVFAATCSFALIHAAMAQDASHVAYPVEELGGCKNKAECKAYCDVSEHMQACVAYAKKNRMISVREIEMAEKFMAAGSKGPGGCRGKEECEAFCDDINHIEACVAFAETNDLMSAEKLEEAKKVRTAIRSGIRPPACKNKKSCDVYCSQAEHMKECITFAEKAGFMQGGELEEAKKVLGAIEKGIRPPACHGKEECNAYCSDDAHIEECITFAEAAGFMKPEEVQMARKTGGKGPGGCRGKEECEVFCGNMANQETCFNFAKEHGLLKDEDLKKMDEGKAQMMQGFEQAPPEVRECLNASLGSDLMERLKNGTALPSMKIGEKMRECFENMRQQMPREEGMQGERRDGQQMPVFDRPMMNVDQMPPEVARCMQAAVGEDAIEKIKSGAMRMNQEMGGKLENCFKQYGGQQENNRQMPFPDERQMPVGVPQEGILAPVDRMQIQERQGMQAGPGGCDSPEACKLYCMSHPQECGVSIPQQGYPMLQQGVEIQPMPPIEYRQMQQQAPMDQMRQVEYQQPMPPIEESGMPVPELQPQLQSGNVMPLMHRMVRAVYGLLGIE